MIHIRAVTCNSLFSRLCSTGMFNALDYSRFEMKSNWSDYTFPINFRSRDHSDVLSKQNLKMVSKKLQIGLKSKAEHFQGSMFTASLQLKLSKLNRPELMCIGFFFANLRKYLLIQNWMISWTNLSGNYLDTVTWSKYPSNYWLCSFRILMNVGNYVCKSPSLMTI